MDKKSRNKPGLINLFIGVVLFFMLGCIIPAKTVRAADDDVVVVDKDNFSTYFDAYGTLKDTDVSKISFTGDFKELGVDKIVINKSLNISSNNAVFEGIYFEITADNTKIDGIIIKNEGLYGFFINNADNVILTNCKIEVKSVNDKDCYAVYAYEAENFEMTNNEVVYVNDTESENRAMALYIDGNKTVSKSAIKENSFDISIPSSYVYWAELPPGSGSWISLPLTEGIKISGCDNLFFENNNLDIKYNKVIGNYDTIYAVDIEGGTGKTSIKNNTLKASGNMYLYGFMISATDLEMSQNYMDLKSNNYIAAIDMEGVFDSCKVEENELHMSAPSDSEGVSYGIYAAYDSGGDDVLFNNNTIEFQSYTGFGIHLLSSAESKNGFNITNNNISGEGSFLEGIAVRVKGICNIKNNILDMCGSDTGDIYLWDQFSKKPSYGIYIDDSSEAVISGNTIKASDTGIYSYVKSTITDNDIETDGEYTIDVDDSELNNTVATVTLNNLKAKERVSDDSVKHADNDDVHDNNAGQKEEPSPTPTETPTAVPTAKPTVTPTAVPTAKPTVTPTVEPTATPTAEPTAAPTVTPTATPVPDEDITKEIPYAENVPVEEKEEVIKKTDTDKKDVEGSTNKYLGVKTTPKGKNSIKITWKKIKGASGYKIYGAKCGKKMEYITTIAKPSAKSLTIKKLKKGTYYKYLVVAYKTTSSGDKVISTSKSSHAVTDGSKKGNPTSLKIKKAKLTVKKGKSTKIKATVKKKKPVSVHIAKIRYESADPTIATVDNKGKVKGINKGKTKIYVYTQNGITKTVTVTVK